MTTLDALIAAGLERGLNDAELRRLLLDYRDGESAADSLSRMFPLDEQSGSAPGALSGSELPVESVPRLATFTQTALDLGL